MYLMQGTVRKNSKMNSETRVSNVILDAINSVDYQSLLYLDIIEQSHGNVRNEVIISGK